MNKTYFINRMIKFMIQLAVITVLLFSTGFTSSTNPDKDTHQLYLPLVTYTPQDIYDQLLNSLGGSDNLFYVYGQLAFIGRGHQLVIVDVSAPNIPKYLTEIQLPAIPTYLTVKDGYGYLALGNGGFAILNLLQPAQGYLLSRLPLSGFSQHVLISDTVVFVSSDQALYVLDISQPSYPKQLSSIATSANYSLFHDSLLLVVHGNGFTFFDISNLGTPIKVGNYENWVFSGILAVGAEHIYIEEIGCGRLGCDSWIDVIDISDPSQPLSVNYFDISFGNNTMLIDGDIAYISAGANIIVAQINPDGSLEKLTDFQTDIWGSILLLENDKLYLGANDSIEILDVSDPLNIEQAGIYTNSYYDFGTSQVNLPFIYYRANLIGAEAETSSLLALDVADPEEPELISETPFRNLNIQSGFTANQIYLDGDKLYMTYPTGDYSWFWMLGIKIYDLQQPTLPVEVAEYLPGTAENGLGVWFEDHRNSVQIEDAIGYIMTMGNYLEIVDLSNPESPIVLSSLPTNAKMVSIDGSHAYLISEVYEGSNSSLHLLTLDIANPEQPTFQSDYVITTTLSSNYLDYTFDVNDRVAYLGLPGALHLIDVSDPANPLELSNLPIESELSPNIIVAEAGLAFVGVEGKLEIIDVSMPHTPTQLAEFDVYDRINSIQVLGNYVYLASNAGAYILNIDLLDQPRISRYYPGYSPSIQTGPHYPVYVSKFADGLEIFKPYPLDLTIK